MANLRSKLGHELVSILVLPRVQFVKRRFDSWQFAQLQCVQPRSHWERHVTRKSLNQMLNKIVNAVWSLFNGSKSVWYHPAFLAAYFGYTHFYVDVWKPWLRKHLVRCLIFQTANGHQMVMFIYTEENWKAKFEGLPVLLQKYANNVPLGTFKKVHFRNQSLSRLNLQHTRIHTKKKTGNTKNARNCSSVPFHLEKQHYELPQLSH